RRHHRHRYPGRGGHWLRPAEIPPARRYGADRDRRHRGAGEPRRPLSRGGMTSQIIDRMAVEVDGPNPGGPATGADAVLCIHGLGGPSNFSTPICLALSSRYRIVRPDLPGSGRSPARDGLSIQVFAEAMAKVARSLGIERIHVIGHSLGSIVAQHLA